MKLTTWKNYDLQKYSNKTNKHKEKKKKKQQTNSDDLSPNPREVWVGNYK